MGTEPVEVHSLPGAWGLPSASPFCLKLLTWLRMAGISYRLKVLKGPPKSPTGKAPYITRPDGSVLPDSNYIIDTLTAERGVTLDEHLTPAQRATAHLVQRTLEKSLYFVAMWNRWVPHWQVTRDGFFAGMHPVVRSVVAPVIRRDVLRQPRAQGVGLNAPEQIYAEGSADVQAVARVLGDRDFFFSQPSTIDAAAYGLFANLLKPEVEDPLTEAVRSQANIVAFCDRMRERYWQD
ncbi:MAG TPA: glutathione S-transferase family protein [Gammaproteobacteria bacterium]|nr:glutathione S-transferase family protein [Gammaproteobacteria bacterium]